MEKGGVGTVLEERFQTHLYYNIVMINIPMNYSK